MIRPIAILWSCWWMGVALVGMPPAAAAHGVSAELYRTRILEVAPEGLPVEVRVDGDQIRFENHGDEEVVICGYDTKRCEGWVRIGPDGVFEDRDSRAFHANAEGDELGDVPKGAGSGEPNFHRVRSRPAFYAYHDHRVHWMGGESLPPGVDDADPDAQRVFDGRIEFRYGDTDGVVRTRLEYVGGRTWLQRYGEYALMVTAIVVMLVFFALDARRRRRRRSGDDARPEADDQAK